MIIEYLPACRGWDPEEGELALKRRGSIHRDKRPTSPPSTPTSSDKKAKKGTRKTNDDKGGEKDAKAKSKKSSSISSFSDSEYHASLTKQKGVHLQIDEIGRERMPRQYIDNRKPHMIMTAMTYVAFRNTSARGRINIITVPDRL